MIQSCETAVTTAQAPDSLLERLIADAIARLEAENDGTAPTEKRAVVAKGDRTNEQG